MDPAGHDVCPRRTKHRSASRRRPATGLARPGDRAGQPPSQPPVASAPMPTVVDDWGGCVWRILFVGSGNNVRWPLPAGWSAQGAPGTGHWPQGRGFLEAGHSKEEIVRGGTGVLGPVSAPREVAQAVVACLGGRRPPPFLHKRGVYAAVAEWRSLAGLVSIHGSSAAGRLLTRVCRFKKLTRRGELHPRHLCRMVVDWRSCRVLVHLAAVTPQPCLSMGCWGEVLTAPNSASLHSLRPERKIETNLLQI